MSNDAVRAAQKAFFEAALAGVSSPSVPSAVQSQVKPVRAVAPSDSQARPNANLRPGSLLDIKV